MKKMREYNGALVIAGMFFVLANLLQFYFVAPDVTNAEVEEVKIVKEKEEVEKTLDFLVEESRIEELPGTVQYTYIGSVEDGRFKIIIEESENGSLNYKINLSKNINRSNLEDYDIFEMFQENHHRAKHTVNKA